MAANTTPIFALTPQTSFARSAAANTARDGSGTIITACTAAINGTRIDRITITSAQATAALNSAMVARIFISDTSGLNYRLYKEVVLSAVTASATVIGSTATITIQGGLLLKSGQLLGVCTSVYAGVQDQVDFVVEGSDY